MNSFSHNFKLKSGSGTAFLSAALLLFSATASINAGESKAAPTTACLLSNLSGCVLVKGDKKISNIVFSSIPAGLFANISLSENSGAWNLTTSFEGQTFLSPGVTMTYDLMVTNPAKYLVLTDISNTTNKPFMTGSSTDTLTQTAGAPIVGPLTSTDGAITSGSWTGTSTQNVSFSRTFSTSGTATISSISHTFTQSTQPTSTVPAPLPLLGAAAAFGFTRRLRSRIKNSAIA